MAETERVDEAQDQEAPTRSHAIKARLPEYEFDEYKNHGPVTAENCCDVHDLIGLLEADDTVEIQGKVYAFHKESGKPKLVRFDNKKSFLEAFKSTPHNAYFREQGFDFFGTDLDLTTNTVGQDFVPLLGGPFNRQQYLNNMLQSHQQAFFAYHHDPIAREAINIIKNFTLGRGWRVDCEDQKALAIWKAFEEANDLYQVMEYVCVELALYGETFIRWLPNNEKYLAYNVYDEQKPIETVLPRLRLVDPSIVWEILTYPEDIQRVLAYQLVYPTQYSIYTTTDKGKPVPSTKFIYEQVLAKEIDHFKINTVSNEKRGRSDLYPIFGYLKRLRDSVNYSIIGLQKNSAWSMDTTIKGGQNDIDSYISDMNALGTVPAPGSEFVHTDKIERKYLSNEGGGKGGQHQSFDWCMSMICAGLGIPVNYFGTHISTAGTRASSMVATEPVAKKFEGRQLVLERVLKKMAKRLFKEFNIQADIEVTFPDIVTQDRSSKLKDLALSQSMNWISEDRAAEIASKELGVSDYDRAAEIADIKKNLPAEQISPLTGAPGVPPSPSGSGLNVPDVPRETGKVDSAERRSIKLGRGA